LGSATLDKKTARRGGGDRWEVYALITSPLDWITALPELNKLTREVNQTGVVEVVQEVDGNAFLRFSLIIRGGNSGNSGNVVCRFAAAAIMKVDKTYPVASSNVGEYALPATASKPKANEASRRTYFYGPERVWGPEKRAAFRARNTA